MERDKAIINPWKKPVCGQSCDTNRFLHVPRVLLVYLVERFMDMMQKQRLARSTRNVANYAFISLSSVDDSNLDQYLHKILS
jgi:hypothetical protein